MTGMGERSTCETFSMVLGGFKAICRSPKCIQTSTHGGHGRGVTAHRFCILFKMGYAFLLVIRYQPKRPFLVLAMSDSSWRTYLFAYLHDDSLPYYFDIRNSI